MWMQFRMRWATRPHGPSLRCIQIVFRLSQAIRCLGGDGHVVGVRPEKRQDMKAKRLCAVLASVIALVVALAGCAVPGTNLEALKNTYVGAWELYSADFEGTESDISHDTYLYMSETLGMHATIDFDSDGNALVDIFGTRYSGTWIIKDEKTITLDVEGDSVDCPLDSDGNLAFGYDGESMVFEKRSDTPDMSRTDATPTSTDDSSSSSDVSLPDISSPESDAYMDAYVDDVTELGAKDITVAQDDYVTIKVCAIGSDFEGDPGHLMTVYNNTDNEIFVTLADDVQVDGTAVTATLIRHVDSAATKKGYLFFDKGEVTLTDSSTCTGTIEVYGADYTLLKTYDLNVK